MKKFNMEEFLNFIVLLGFSTFMYYLITTGKLSNFISPKMVKYIIFSFVVLTILTFYQGNKIFSPPNSRPISIGHWILMLTLIIGFTAAEKGVSLSITTNKGVNLPNYVKSDKLKVPSSYNSEDKNLKDKEIKEGYMEGNTLVEKDNTIVIDEQNFYKAVTEIGTNLDKYTGKKVTINGFVFKKEDLKEDEFVIARMSMACCAADAQVIGLMAKWDRTLELKKDSWVKVEGIIEEVEYKETGTNTNLTLPVIKVTNIENLTTPDNIYVYPE
jgi:putative membrane protein